MATIKLDAAKKIVKPDYEKKVPEKRPQLSREELIDMIHTEHPEFELSKFFVVGIRGYYEDTMGKPDQNDRNIYDDAIFLVGEESADFFAFNGNTDPSAFKESIATLKAGIWPVYKFDLHKGQYLALCQRAGNVTVIRDGKGEDTGSFGINIHKGGIWGTGSLGCQTIPQNQWPEFIGKATDLAKKYYGKNFRMEVYTYVLLEF